MMVSGILLAMLTGSVVATPLQARPAPDLAYCEALPTDPEALGNPNLAVDLPRDWQGPVAASSDWMAFATVAGTTYCQDLSWFYEVGAFERFGNRFYGFAWEGIEAWGYVLVDPTGTGSAIDTGARPVFSPGGYRFATVQISDAGWGGFEGFAVWQVQPSGIAPLHVDTSTSTMLDWRIEEWLDEDCVKLSAVAQEDFGGDWDNLGTAPRRHFVSAYADGWKLAEGDDCPTYD